MSQYTKAIISNKLAEVTQQSYLPPSGRTSLGGCKPYTNQSIENYRTNQKVSINCARKNIQRLLECNITEQYAFITLTFRPIEKIDVTNIKACNDLFSRFKKRLSHHLKKNNLPNFRYLGVIEFQDKHRQGAIHYHVVCNLIEIPLETLQEIWLYGLVHRVVATSDVIQNEKSLTI